MDGELLLALFANSDGHDVAPLRTEDASAFALAQDVEEAYRGSTPSFKSAYGQVAMMLNGSMSVMRERWRF